MQKMARVIQYLAPRTTGKTGIELLTLWFEADPLPTLPQPPPLNVFWFPTLAPLGEIGLDCILSPTSSGGEQRAANQEDELSDADNLSSLD
ncbi:unnamed protein product [Pleuronectes platessa]|uniref:Uncharacterized protein n=1 Tax=Pleuronectes platessa TaxID=8262 RepID=A0A9N7VLT1_PLEPL|nr:unnamed protein product [Pleuronectes platessa]